jgi:hypothetical protein
VGGGFQKKYSIHIVWPFFFFDSSLSFSLSFFLAFFFSPPLTVMSNLVFISKTKNKREGGMRK